MKSHIEQHGSITLTCRPAPTQTWGSKFIFSEHELVAYQSKWNHKCSNMVTRVLLAKGQNIFLGEIGHIAYQIKENPECSNMVANIFPADPPSQQLQPGGGGVKWSKFNFFRTS